MGDPEVLELARPHLPRVMSAVLRGAQIVGGSGDRDRVRLFKILGLPWGDPPRLSDRGGGTGINPIDLMAQRVARAHQRAQQGIGRTTATLTMSVTSEGAADNDFAEVAHLSFEQERDPPTLDAAPTEDDEPAR